LPRATYVRLVAVGTSQGRNLPSAGPATRRSRRCRADDLDVEAWSRFLLDRVLSKPDRGHRARLANGRPIEGSDQRALYRWLTERNRPSIWSADRFLTRYGGHLDDFFRFCEEEGLEPWASGQAPAWYETRAAVAPDQGLQD
jgi:hypothetical protein